MALFAKPKIKRSRDGSYDVNLETWERDLLRTLPGQLRDLLTTDDPALERLYPPAYVDDAERNDEYQRLMRGDLTSRRLSSLDVMEATVDEPRLDEEQLVAWMGAINDLRLVLGTRLDVTDDPLEDQVDEGDERAPAFALYGYLGWLQEAVVAALSSGL
ncbi:MAG TPA: DUF2017 family protein [Acidimicrobiales bacterium]|nr:DUF2017 family protein [Acidimicrobiales bacterium]